MGGNSSSGNSGVRITSNQPINVKKGQNNLKRVKKCCILKLAFQWGKIGKFVEK